MKGIKKILFILGPAGSGKSTQAEFLSKKLGYKHIVESDLLKKEIKKGTKLGKELNKEMNKGILVPFEITCDLLFNEINKSKQDKIIVDGFPREISQAITLDYYIYKQKYKIQALIYIDTSKEKCIERLLKRKREDDTKDAIKERLEIYFNETIPVIKRFEKKGLLIKVNGNHTIEEVNKELIKKIK
jgi:adenylate kinase family enzyme